MSLFDLTDRVFILLFKSFSVEQGLGNEVSFV